MGWKGAWRGGVEEWVCWDVGWVGEGVVGGGSNSGGGGWWVVLVLVVAMVESDEGGCGVWVGATGWRRTEACQVVVGLESRASSSCYRW